jgi:DNA-binding transcriptional MerR regulator
MKYLIHDVSQLFGIAPQTIRYYEKLGAISNTRDKLTGYRYFDSWDIGLFIPALRYRSYGLSLREVGGMVREKNYRKLGDISAVLRDREKAMGKEITWLRYLHLHLKDHIARIEEVEAAEGCFRLVQRPPLFALLYGRSYMVTQEPELRRMGCP